MTNQQKNRQNWVFNKISIYPINLLKSGFINHQENAKTRLLYQPIRMLQLKSDHINASEEVKKRDSHTPGKTVKQ